MHDVVDTPVGHPKVVVVHQAVVSLVNNHVRVAPMVDDLISVLVHGAIWRIVHQSTVPIAMDHCVHRMVGDAVFVHRHGIPSRCPCDLGAATGIDLCGHVGVLEGPAAILQLPHDAVARRGYRAVEDRVPWLEGEKRHPHVGLLEGPRRIRASRRLRGSQAGAVERRWRRRRRRRLLHDPGDHGGGAGRRRARASRASRAIAREAFFQVLPGVLGGAVCQLRRHQWRKARGGEHGLQKGVASFVQQGCPAACSRRGPECIQRRGGLQLQTAIACRRPRGPRPRHPCGRCEGRPKHRGYERGCVVSGSGARSGWRRSGVFGSLPPTAPQCGRRRRSCSERPSPPNAGGGRNQRRGWQWPCYQGERSEEQGRAPGRRHHRCAWHPKDVYIAQGPATKDRSMRTPHAPRREGTGRT
mmetsp:Transcript_23904/g.67003  ORF Transcript_23904/g.67003 Transcript_23904/m.67003 type:complete len:413 (-) Transcript_23904:7-1245(-)